MSKSGDDEHTKREGPADLTVLIGGGQPDKQKQGLREMQKGFETTVEILTLMAKLTRHKYLALKEEGFTTEEALQLCEKLM